MLRFVGKVAYVDGREVEFETGSAAAAHYEEYAARHGLPMPGDPDRPPSPTMFALLVAHWALGNGAGFEVWRREVDGVELEATGVNPTPADPGLE